MCYYILPSMLYNGEEWKSYVQTENLSEVLKIRTCFDYQLEIDCFEKRRNCVLNTAETSQPVHSVNRPCPSCLLP